MSTLGGLGFPDVVNEPFAGVTSGLLSLPTFTVLGNLHCIIRCQEDFVAVFLKETSSNKDSNIMIP